MVNGLFLGAIYALAAIGFVLIHNVSGSVNFSHGALVLLGTYLGVMYVDIASVSMWLVLVLVALTMVGIGMLLELVAFRPLEGKPFVAVFISTLALGLIIAQVILLVWGPRPRAGTALVRGQLTVGSVTVPNQGLIILGLTLAVVAAQWVMFHRTRIGIRLRATADDSVTASMMGIRTGRNRLLVFGIAAALAGVAGVLIAPLSFVDPSRGGIDIMIKIYIAVVIGGFGSEVGAAAGGIVLGLAEVLTAGYLSATYRDVIIYSLLIAVLVLRPSGLFGQPTLREA
ncbi:branched-chain amino acid ABC transporter permease [Nocardioides terrisoli]|uniref:branched-chain amino acid ABC transporter permease n=1 Tax=Nocardioides terrisoli TaxID=3388267 RepID=UPI00287B8881|nr:branched-chain amino acid ABC transporter permease [Nocardioides marmorisolisilvae]